MCLGMILLYLLWLGFTVFLCLWIHIFYHSQKIHILVSIPEGMNRENQERKIGDVAVVCAYSQLNNILCYEYIVTFVFYSYNNFISTSSHFIYKNSQSIPNGLSLQMFSLKKSFQT